MSPSGTVPARGPLPPEEVLRARAKAALRARIRGLRATVPLSACAARSARIVARLLGLPVIRDARSVALFWPIEDKHEVDLRTLDAALRARGVTVAYPTVEASGEMVFRVVEDPARMEDHDLGFRAPAPGSPLAPDLDVVVVPAIAIDPAGQRLGYGAGFYDRALAPPLRAVTVGVAFDFQLVPEVATTRGDVPVQWIVSDARAFRATEPVPAPERP